MSNSTMDGKSVFRCLDVPGKQEGAVNREGWLEGAQVWLGEKTIKQRPRRPSQQLEALERYHRELFFMLKGAGCAC